MNYLLKIIAATSILLTTACTTQTSTQNQNPVEDQDPPAQTITLPDLVELEFTPLELTPLSESQPDPNLEHLNTISLGSIGSAPITLQVYKENNESNPCGFSYETVSFLTYNNEIYSLPACTSASFLEETPPRNIAYHIFEPMIEDQQKQLVAAIELAANGPGRMQYFIYDQPNQQWHTFEAWGDPSIVDLDHTGHQEFVIQFPGLHMSRPDVIILRWNNGILETSASLKNAIGISDTFLSDIIYIQDKWLFEVTLMGENGDTSQHLYTFNSSKLTKVLE